MWTRYILLSTGNAVVGFCEHGNEHLVSVKGEFRDSARWSWCCIL
jgi:hypothetical protein